jgi:hypothetical protein
MQQCTSCLETKPFSKFYGGAIIDGKEYYHPTCKSCSQAREPMLQMTLQYYSKVKPAKVKKKIIKPVVLPKMKKPKPTRTILPIVERYYAYEEEERKEAIPCKTISCNLILDNYNRYDECTYCGTHADTKDHVLPKSITWNYNTVPCCFECNSVLGSHVLLSIGERKSFLLGWYSKRYKNILESPNWYEDELEELGEVMREEIRASIAVKKQLLARIKLLKFRQPSDMLAWPTTS